MVLCIVFAHGFQSDGFWSMFLDASECIYTYYNIEINIMKNQFGSPSFGIQEKIFVFICFMCYSLTFVYLLFLEFACRSFLYGVKTYIWYQSCFGFKGMPLLLRGFA